MEGAAIVDLPELGGSQSKGPGLKLFTLVDFTLSTAVWGPGSEFAVLRFAGGRRNHVDSAPAAWSPVTKGGCADCNTTEGSQLIGAKSPYGRVGGIDVGLGMAVRTLLRRAGLVDRRPQRHTHLIVAGGGASVERTSMPWRALALCWIQSISSRYCRHALRRARPGRSAPGNSRWRPA
jgi:hypothetical protein